MRLSAAAALVTLLGGVYADAIVERQADTTPSPGGSSSALPSSTSSSSSSTPEDTSTSSSSQGDSTVFVTATVTNSNGGGTETRKTTVVKTGTTTILSTKTTFSTTTVTSSDQDTATSTVYATSTVTVNAKRDVVERTAMPAEALAAPLAEPTAPPLNAKGLDVRGILDGLFKRDDVTRTTTVTVDGDGDASTVTNTVTSTNMKTITSFTTKTNVITETDQADASTTVTTTSTLTVTSTADSTSTSSSSGNSDSSGDSSSSSDDDGGLSTGAQIGIGVGVGVGGLLIIGALAWWCIRRRRRGPKPDPDELMGASEVPVGAPTTSSPGMSQHTPAAAAMLTPHRTPAKAEGYRGTAMGDGRAGYAKPEPFGAAYTQSSQTPSTGRQPSPMTNRSSTLASGGGYAATDSLPEHPTPQAAELGSSDPASKWHITNAAEMDTSQPSTAQVTPQHTAGTTGTRPGTGGAPPASDVYEMP